MKGYVIYDPATGAIEDTTIVSEYVQLGGTSDTGIAIPLPTSQSYVLITDELYDEVEYKVDLTTLDIVPQTSIDTPLAITTNTNQAYVINGLPDCTASYQPTPSSPYPGIPDTTTGVYLAEDDITDGTLSITVDLAGSYNIILTSPIFLDTTVVLTVEDA